jgi:hypothetical protein
MQTNLSNDVLNAALAGLEAQKRTVEEHITQVRAMLGLGADGQKRRGRPDAAAVESGTSNDASSRFSAETRARMAAAQRKRWAAARGETATGTKAPTKKRKLSAAARKRISEATKKRWAAYRTRKRA